MTMTEVMARDMEPATRNAVQSLVHRPLADNDCVSVIVRSEAPRSAAERAAAWERLASSMQELRSSVRATPEELDAAINEAMRAVRPGYESVR